jgi:hypothetical protein
MNRGHWSALCSISLYYFTLLTHYRYMYRFLCSCRVREHRLAILRANNLYYPIWGIITCYLKAIWRAFHDYLRHWALLYYVYMTRIPYQLRHWALLYDNGMASIPWLYKIVHMIYDCMTSLQWLSDTMGLGIWCPNDELVNHSLSTSTVDTCIIE